MTLSIFLFFPTYFWQFIKHKHKLAHVPSSLVGKKAQLFIKAKREQVKVQDNQFRASLSCLQRGRRKKGRREEEDGEREAEGKAEVEGWGGAGGVHWQNKNEGIPRSC